jgi:(2Fe-2S) ferredoxin
VTKVHTDCFEDCKFPPVNFYFSSGVLKNISLESETKTISKHN